MQPPAEVSKAVSKILNRHASLAVPGLLALVIKDSRLNEIRSTPLLYRSDNALLITYYCCLHMPARRLARGPVCWMVHCPIHTSQPPRHPSMHASADDYTVGSRNADN